MGVLNKIAFIALAFTFAMPVFSAELNDSQTKIHRGYRMSVGQPHPDFVLPSVDDGEPLQLSDYRGKKVLLLHFASW